MYAFHGFHIQSMVYRNIPAATVEVCKCKSAFENHDVVACGINKDEGGDDALGVTSGSGKSSQ